MKRLPLLALVLALLLTGCGFKPVAPAEIPFENLFIAASDYSSFGAEFKRYVESYSRSRLADAPGKADAVLEILGETQQKQILSLSSAGRVQEYLLRYRIAFRVRDAAGNELLPPDEIMLERDLIYDDDVALAKENEEVFLYQDMRNDAIRQLVRRLSIIDLTAPPVAS
jgi:LPS-assembly lipoprotein